MDNKYMPLGEIIHHYTDMTMLSLSSTNCCPELSEQWTKFMVFHPQKYCTNRTYQEDVNIISKLLCTFVRKTILSYKAQLLKRDNQCVSCIPALL